MYWFTFFRALAMVALLSMCSERILAGTQIVTYVLKTQEERESTRFTLTEWLRIKERMKLMDLWLALIAQPPKQAEFRPEFSLGWTLLEADAAASAGTRLPPRERRDASLFLTNIVSTSLGLRMLNIDFGFEIQDRRNTGLARSSSTSLAALQSAPSQSADVADANAAFALPQCRHGGMQFRIFGKNVQDTSLILKYGRFASEDPLTGIGSYGRMLGASTNLYLLGWLGVEGQLTRYDSDAPEFDAPWHAATLRDYGAFIEISLIRLSGGVFQEDWQGGSAEAPATRQRQGYFSGMRLLL